MVKEMKIEVFSKEFKRFILNKDLKKSKLLNKKDL